MKPKHNRIPDDGSKIPALAFVGGLVFVAIWIGMFYLLDAAGF